MRRMNIALATILCGGLLGHAADWPQWLGPNRNGSSPEKVLTTWPKDGPKLLWKVPGGDGYSSVAVVGNRAYTPVPRGKEEPPIFPDVSDGKRHGETSTTPSYKNKN